MPELPEVESFRKYVEDTSLHQRIARVQLAAQGMLIETTDKELKKVLEGNSFSDTFRHGKFFFIKLEKEGSLMLHFGMTGDLLYYEPDHKSPKAYVLLVQFVNGKNLLFSDPRRLGKIGLIKDVGQFIKKHGYGKDALQITNEEFLVLFRKKRTSIKAALMNQKSVAGVGNEFSDEILFQSRIHPASTPVKLSSEQLAEIYSHMKRILMEAVSYNADRKNLEHYFFLENRKAGLTCPRCGARTVWQTVGGRSSYFCPSCQKLYA
jgi:formamidopyrimidine-DNA glycosylase